jgi:hypothetical protein
VLQVTLLARSCSRPLNRGHGPELINSKAETSGVVTFQAPARVSRAGEGFYEVPGSHHRISENARDPASLLAVFVVDSKDSPLTIPDKK